MRGARQPRHRGWWRQAQGRLEPAPFDYLDFETDGPLLDEAIGAAIEACKV